MICYIFLAVAKKRTSFVAQQWLANPNMVFATAISEETAEILPVKEGVFLKEAKVNGLIFRITKYENGFVNCSIRGSLHKSAKGENHSRFTFAELQIYIKQLCDEYHLNPSETSIHGFEVQINLKLMYSPLNFLKMCIAYKNKSFASTDKSNPDMCKMVEVDDYILKMYDKGKESNVNEFLLRYGKRIKNMRILRKYGIKTLSDLMDGEKVAPLIIELLKTVSHIRIYNHDKGLIDSLKRNNEKIKWLQFASPRYWIDANKDERHKAKLLLKKLSNKLGLPDYNTQLSNWIGYEWRQHFTDKEWATFTPHIKKHLDKLAAPIKATFTLFIFRVYKSPEQVLHGSGDFKTINEKEDNIITTLKPIPEKRFCATCSCDISHKKKGSKNCSKRCRNKASGKARTERRKQKKQVDC
ncbi:MAG: hypothetical protein P9M03_02775 [Candidatus Theseobacter exili]|nr:hypothetical protein [Candidatus Theseobacter exili]